MAKKKRKSKPLSRPKQVVIFHLPYKIVWSPGLVKDDDYPASEAGNGLCDSDAQRLTINSKLNRGKQAEILIHEIMHAWHFANCLDDAGLQKMTEEDLVALESKALALILRDNPELFAWLIDQLTDWS